MKRFVFSTLIAAGLCAPAFADTVLPGHNLVLVEAVAEFSLPVVKNWAANAEPFAAMAAPEVPNAFFMRTDDPRRAVKSSVSQGATSLAQADAEALALCTETLPAGMLPCVIVAHVSPE